MWLAVLILIARVDLEYPRVIEHLPVGLLPIAHPVPPLSGIGRRWSR